MDNSFRLLDTRISAEEFDAVWGNAANRMRPQFSTARSLGFHRHKVTGTISRGRFFRSLFVRVHPRCPFLLYRQTACWSLNITRSSRSHALVIQLLCTRKAHINTKQHKDRAHHHDRKITSKQMARSRSSMSTADLKECLECTHQRWWQNEHRCFANTH